MSSSRNRKQKANGAATHRTQAATKRAKPTQPPRHDAPLAVATDGTIFLNVNVLDAIDHANLAGRKLFIGAALTDEEAETAREILDNAGHELRAKIAGSLRAPSAQTREERKRDHADEATS